MSGCAGCNGPGMGGQQMGLTPEFVTFLADRVQASSRGANGQTVQVNTSSIPLRDAAGRHAHVADLLVKADAQLTKTGATMTQNADGYALLGLIDNIFVEDVSGWQYQASIDGRDWRDDVLARQRYLVVSDPDDQTDATATVTEDVSFYTQFAEFDDGIPTTDGLIPLAALRARGDGSIRFNVATDLPGGITGVVWDGFQNNLEIYLGIVYLDHYHVDAPWNLECYTITEPMGQLRHCDRLTAYAWLLHKPEDTGGDDVDDYAGITVQAGGVVTKSGQTLVESYQADLMCAQRDPDNSNALLFANCAAGGTRRSLFLSYPQKNRKAMCHGTIDYQFSTRSTHTSSRFLHRTIAPLSAARDMALKKAVGLSVSRDVVRVNNPGTAPSQRLKAFLPRAVVKG